MEYVLTSKQAKDSDNYTISLGTLSLALMERAGKEVAKIIQKRISKNKSILIVVGKGGNGGDGYVIGRFLLENGYNISILDINCSHSNDCLTNKNKFKGKIYNKISSDFEFDVIVDAIFGYGLKSIPKDEYLNLIDWINTQTQSFIISIDINSGIDSNTGKVLGTAVFSDLTIAINDYKFGHFLNEGIDFYNELIKVNIELKNENYLGFARILEKKEIKNLFPKRKKHTNKGDYGKVMLIGGSKTLNGAILLSANALSPLLLGCGYSCIGIPRSLHPLYALKNLENIYYFFDDNDGNIVFNEEQIKKILNYDVISIGMGIGVSEEVYKIISYLLKNYSNKLLIDADGLNSLAKYGVDILINHKCEVILTPHLKEFSRLINLSIEEINEKYVDFAMFFAKKYNINLVLKSNVTLITNGNETYLNVNGTPALAKGGSGDVLSGIISGVLTKENDTLFECAAGCYILGRCSELACEKINENSILASDLPKFISDTLNEIEK